MYHDAPLAICSVESAIRSWLQGFVDYFGIDAATELLDGVGDVSVAPAMPKQ